jgi:hypothetical protein
VSASVVEMRPKPVQVSGRTFLEAMFVDAMPGAHTMICAHRNDPNTAGPKEWAGCPWQPGRPVPALFDNANAYLTVSTFEADPLTGKQRRRKACFVSMHAVMIDDVGTKVAREKLKLAPTAIIATSPKNYQAFYFLIQDSDTRERDVCERLVNRMIAAGLTADNGDPGMKGVTRYGRLPMGFNNKAKYVAQLGKPWRVQCIEFDPARRYSIQQIAAAWQLDMKPGRAPRAPVLQFTAAETKLATDGFGLLLRLLQLTGRYRERNAAGWHEIVCPWVHTHTDRAETGTAIAEPSKGNSFRGGFRCHHAHCSDLSIRHLWSWAGGMSKRLLRSKS